MRCPKCKRYMEKIVNSHYLNAGVYFYKCKHCNYISDLMTDNNKPFGENYPEIFPFNAEEKRLKKENIKIVNEMYEKHGMLTDDDKLNLAIWLYEFNKKGGIK